jgi:hypothetical protein
MIFLLKNHLSRTIIKMKKIFTLFYIILNDVYIYLILIIFKFILHKVKKLR